MDREIVSGIFWKFGEKIASQMVSFCVSILLTRILLPDDYGIAAIVNIFIAIAEIFVTSGLGTALIQKKDATDLDFSTIFWCNLFLSILLYLLIFAVAPVIARIYKIPLLTSILRVLGLSIPVNGCKSIQEAYVSRCMDFKKFFWATLIGTIASAIVGIFMAISGLGVWALVGQILTNISIDTIVLVFTIDWKPKFIFSWRSAKPLIGYGWKILGTDLIGTIFNQMNSFVIGKKYTSADLAYYSHGKKIPDLINVNVTTALYAVLFPAMTKSNGIEEIKSIRRKCLKMVEYIMFPLMLGLFAVADKLIILLFTDKWAFSITYVRINCIASIAGILGITLIQELKAIGRSDVTLKMELVTKPIFFLVLLISMQFGVKAIASTLIIDEILAFFFNLCPVIKYIGFDFKSYICDALPTLSIATIMMSIVYFVGTQIQNDLLSLVCQVLLGISIYIGLSALTHNESFNILKRITKNKIDQIKK